MFNKTIHSYNRQGSQKRIRSPLKKQSMIFKQNSDEEDSNSEDQKMEVINLNYFKVRKEQKKFNLLQMLQQGKLAEDEVDHNPHFPSPTLNTKLIHNIFQIYHSEKKEIQNEVRIHGSSEKVQRQTNQKLVNQILFNKMRQRRVVSQHELSDTTSNVLQSFKSLTSMFKNVNQLVDYHSLAIQIRQSQAQISINKEVHKNLERQQFNFNYIVEGRLNQLKQQNQEIYKYQLSLQKLRIENCKLRQQVNELSQEINSIKIKYAKQREQALIHEESKKWDKLQLFQSIDQNETIELSRIKTFFMEFQQQLTFNTIQLKKEEELLSDLKHLKKQVKQDLTEFLKQVLYSDEIQISGSLVIIIKLLIQINESITISDFPGFLDIQSKQFLMQKAKYEIQNDHIKLKAKESKSQINTSENKVKYEQKLIFVMSTLENMKKQKYALKSTELLGEQNQTPENQSFKNSNQSFTNNNLDNVITELEESEIQRLQQIYQGKQIPISSLKKLIKTIQAEFGYKQMYQKLSGIVSNYEVVKSIIKQQI